MKNLILQSLIVTCSALTLVGCIKYEKVYEWQRDKNEIFYLRYKISDTKKLTLLNKYKENGVSRMYISDYFSECQFFNESNFICEAAPGKEKFVVQDGEVIWYYWGEVRKYKMSPAETFAQTLISN